MYLILSIRRKQDFATASSSSSRPPGPPPGGAAEEKRKYTFKPQPLAIQNPVQPTPSIQPSGVQVPGQFGAAQPNTGILSLPAHLAPSTNKTREDDKPESKTMREGADPAVRKRAEEQTQASQKKQHDNEKL